MSAACILTFPSQKPNAILCSCGSAHLLTMPELVTDAISHLFPTFFFSGTKNEDALFPIFRHRAVREVSLQFGYCSSMIGGEVSSCSRVLESPWTTQGYQWSPEDTRCTSASLTSRLLSHLQQCKGTERFKRKFNLSTTSKTSVSQMEMQRTKH